MSELTQARAAVSTLRDAVREGRVIEFRERDELVIAIHRALDHVEAQPTLTSTAVAAMQRWLRHTPECDAAAWEQRNRYHRPDYARPACSCGLDVLVTSWQHAADEQATVYNALVEALQELRINANRLCDRQLGGTYEEDCRRSLKKAEAALALVVDNSGPPVAS
jgi:hypothetical protein